MKVIHLSFADRGGGHNAVYRLCHALNKSGVKSLLWVNKSELDDSMVEGPKNKIHQVINILRRHLIRYLLVKRLKTKNKTVHSPSILPSRWLKKINNCNADIIHLHWVQGEMLSIEDIGQIKKPTVWTLHDMWAFCGAEHYTYDNRWQEGYTYKNRPKHESGFDLNLWTWKRKKKYWRKAFQIITPSKWLARCVMKSKLMSSWPVLSIPNPIDTKFWKPINKKNARKKLHLNQENFLILFGATDGSKDSRKGFDLLLDSIKNLKNISKSKKIEFIVFGQDRPKYVPKIGFPIHYLGHINDNSTLRAVFNSADVTVVSSRQDNLPSVAIESIACGTPVVCFDTSGLSDIVDHKKTGYLARAFDTKSLAKGIMWVMQYGKIKKLSLNARKKALAAYSETKVAASYLKIYHQIVNKKNVKLS